MLVRGDFRNLLLRDPDKVILTHFNRAVQIRVRFTGLKLPRQDELLLPNCHEVARAYARAFEVEFIDGLAVYVSSAMFDSKTSYSINSRQMHSWNVISLVDGTKIILDVFPDIGLSMMPVMHTYPHPSYTIPDDPTFFAQLNSVVHDPIFDTSVELLADEFRRIDQLIEARMV